MAKESSKKGTSRVGYDGPRVTSGRYNGGQKTSKYGRLKQSDTDARIGKLGATLSAGGVTPITTTDRHETLGQAMEAAAGSFPMAANAFSGYRDPASTKNHAYRGAIDVGLYNPITERQLNPYQNALTAPAYQAWAQSVKAELPTNLQDAAVSGAYFSPRRNPFTGQATDWADTMHMQLGGASAWGSIDEGYNAAGRAAGYDRPMPTPSLRDGGFLIGDIQDALGPQDLADLATGVEMGYGRLYNDDGSVNLDTLNVAAPPGSTSLSGAMGWGTRPGELGSQPGAPAPAAPARPADRLREALGMPVTMGIRAANAVKDFASGLIPAAPAEPMSMPARPASVTPDTAGGPYGAETAPVGDVTSAPLAPARPADQMRSQLGMPTATPGYSTGPINTTGVPAAYGGEAARAQRPTSRPAPQPAAPAQTAPQPGYSPAQLAAGLPAQAGPAPGTAGRGKPGELGSPVGTPVASAPAAPASSPNLGPSLAALAGMAGPAGLAYGLAQGAKALAPAMAPQPAPAPVQTAPQAAPAPAPASTPAPTRQAGAIAPITSPTAPAPKAAVQEGQRSIMGSKYSAPPSTVPEDQPGTLATLGSMAKGAIKGASYGSMMGVPGSVLGGVIGGLSGLTGPQINSMFGGPQPDGMGGYGHAPSGYSLGYSPFGGAAYVHDSAPVGLKIAASGPGILGALGIGGSRGGGATVTSASLSGDDGKGVTQGTGGLY